MLFAIFVFCVFLAFCTWMFTAKFIKYAIRKDLVDVPSERSSHNVSTPRGGGLSIVIFFLISLVVFDYFEIVSHGLFLSLGVGALGVAILGFWDDHGHVPAIIRLIGHLAAAVFTLIFLSNLYSIPTLIPSYLYIVVAPLGVVYLVWMLNLYNFMDGIDGLASVEAISVCLLTAICVFWAFPDQVNDSLVLSIALASCILGFLSWNFPSAKIFMGDACSGFLGLMLGALSLVAFFENQVLLWCWLILLSVFITDATVTLLIRLYNRENIFKAHRSHAYQIASRKFSSHKVVTLGVLAINLFFLFPIALCVIFEYINPFLGLLCSYLPLSLLVLYFKIHGHS